MKILVVEDEPAIREIEAVYLRQLGYDIVEAENGTAALELAASQSFDMAVIDLNLPGVDGLEVCRTIRESSTMPILIVTARDTDEDEVAGLEIGADDYIKKPFNPNVLAARVQALLRRFDTEELRAGDLKINPHTMTVTKDGQNILLTTTRFKLLFTLASRPNVVFSREQLVDQIYSDPAGHFVYDRTIDAHIKAIRKALGDDPHAPRYIETVIGSGYRFKEGS